MAEYGLSGLERNSVKPRQDVCLVAIQPLNGIEMVVGIRGQAASK